MAFQVNPQLAFSFQKEAYSPSTSPKGAALLGSVFPKGASSPSRPPKRANENTPPRNLVKAVKQPIDFKKMIESGTVLSAVWAANQHGTEILSSLLETEDSPLMDKFLELANDRTLHHAMLSAIATHPRPAVKMIHLLDGRNWVQDSRDVAAILEKLIENYTPAHREVATACLQLFKDRVIDKADINYLFQKIAAPQDQRTFARDDFQMELVTWLFENKHFPTPFAWTQAVQKCAEQGRTKMVELLWKVTRGNALPPAPFNQEWRMLMITQFKSGFATESAYIHLLPFFFPYQLRNDTLGREDVEDACKYKLFEENPAWVFALEVALAEKQLRISYLLLSPHILGQINDPKTLLNGIRLLLRYGRYDLLSEFSQKDLSKIPSHELFEIVKESRTIKHEPALRKMEQLFNSIIRRREQDEDEASRIPFDLSKIVRK